MNKYAAALLSIAVVILTAFVALPANAITVSAIVQLVLLGVSAFVTFFVPLVAGRWQGLLKTGTAILATVLTAALPFILTGKITATEIVIVVLAALNALAVQVGVSMRVDSAPPTVLPALVSVSTPVAPVTVNVFHPGVAAPVVTTSPAVPALVVAATLPAAVPVAAPAPVLPPAPLAPLTAAPTALLN
jgi:hypothetical protein